MRAAFRSALAVVSAGALGASLFAAGSTAGVASATPGYRYHQPCPGPQPVVADAKWADHPLAPGVVLREGVDADTTVYGGPGEVKLHVLRISTAQADVHYAPLHRSIAQRWPLSSLAAGHSHLLAATNTGFFDFNAQAPRGPVFSSDRPLSMGRVHEPVLGFTADKQPTSAQAWLSGSVTVGSSSQVLSGWNYLHPGRGVALYTDAWGDREDVPLPNGRQHTVLRDVHAGRISSGALTGFHVPPSGGELIVASSPATERWLRSVKVGQRVSWTDRVATSSSRRLVQGYGVGMQLVKQAGTVRTSLGCNELDSQAARTAVGYTAGGRSLLVVVVEDDPNQRGNSHKRVVHGLDHKEMSKVMVDLGAVKAWEWDGSGSSELIARMRGTGTLVLRNYCSDGRQRPMPVGFGIFDSGH